MFRYGLTIFLSAFLLFQVQPLFGKFILPWFGGTPATWTTCVLCFQLLLLGGYLYAHLSVSRLNPRQQALLHVVVLGIALGFLPIVPRETWKPTGLESPVWRILGVLAFTVGVPYVILSSTTPLLQAWFAREAVGKSPYRLYALSNFGSFLGLVSYPFVVEPNLTLRTQASLWSATFVLFVAMAGWCAWTARTPSIHDSADADEHEEPVERPQLFERALWLLLPMCGSVVLLATTNEMSQDVAAVPFLWVLPLSLYLVSFTITFDRPRWYWRPLWAVLLPLSVAGALMAMSIGTSLELPIQVALYCAALLACCMVLHGELARIRPGRQNLTRFYLMISAGGALGGLAVSLVAPLVLNGFYEFPVALTGSCFLFAVVLCRQAYREAPLSTTLAHVSLLLMLVMIGVVLVLWFDAGYLQAVNDFSRNMFSPSLEDTSWASGKVEQRLWDLLDHTWQLSGFVVMALLLLMMVVRQRRKPVAEMRTVVVAGPVAVIIGMIGVKILISAQDSSAIESSRNFYGVLRVSDTVGSSTPVRTLAHGHITHGIQRLDDNERRWRTTYYAEDSGVGIAIRQLRELEVRNGGGLRIGVVGLGAGTLAAYGLGGDYIRFYEINANVMRLNTSYFTFLKDTPAKIEITIGDARITMERERANNQPQRFDVLAVDAFSGDAVPLHLLTREAFVSYFYHLNPDGVLAMHVSNHYLDLAPLVHDLAEDIGKTSVQIDNNDDPSRTIYSSKWILVTSNEAFLASDLVRTHETSWSDRIGQRKLVFTDDYANIFRILKRNEKAERETEN